VLVAACASENPEFDPLRRGDPTDGESTSSGLDDAGPADDGGSVADAGPIDSEDTGPPITPAICDEPELDLAVYMSDGRFDIVSCGHTAQAHCVMFRDPARPDAHWQLVDCDGPLGDDTESVDYEVKFAPTGPALDFSGERVVEVLWRHGPEDAGCSFEWIQIRELEAGEPPLDIVYTASAVLTEDSALLIQGDPSPLVAACSCASNELDCCPPDAGLHGVQLTAPGQPVLTLQSGDAPAIIDSEGVQFEVILVRAWQPPVCEAPPEYEWIARRLTQ